MEKFKRVWFKALGEKASEDSKEADLVALIRTGLFLFVVWSAIVDLFILLNILKGWFE